jgi:imidazolonepropionase-like amidohydrolase
MMWGMRVVSSWSGSAVALALIAVFMAAVERAAAQRPTSFACKHVLAADGRSWLEDQTLLAMGPSIFQLRPRRDGEQVDVDFGDAWVVPGLIDLHTHMFLRPYAQISWDEQVRNESAVLRSMRAVRHAEATLRAGFFAVRDLGTEGGGYADRELQKAWKEGIVEGPELFVATRAIHMRGRYGPAPDEPKVEKGAQCVLGIEEIRKAVREQHEGGAQWIKVYADYRNAAGGGVAPTFSAAEMHALCAEAQSLGLPVSAHATTDEGIRNAVEAGAKTIEHGAGASEATLRLMKERGVVLVPCLTANETIVRNAGHSGPMLDRLNAAKAGFQRALAVGVEIGCGSDAGVFAHGENARELELMVEYGMPADAALRSATVIAAKVLGTDRYGSVGGMSGFVVLRADPWKDITTLRVPIAVYRGDERVGL